MKAQTAQQVAATKTPSTLSASFKSLEQLLELEVEQFESGLVEENLPLQVRALNLDNRNDLAPLSAFIELCKRDENVMQSRFVNELNFLRGEYEEFEEVDKILSLAVTSGDEILAHAALRFDSTHCAEIIFTAVHPEHREHSFRFARVLFRKIQALAETQGWKTLYQYNPASESCLQMIATRCFDSVETAILPARTTVDALPSDAYQSANRSYLVMTHSFVSADEDGRTVYPPHRHAGKIREVFEALNLNRMVVDGKILRNGTGTGAANPFPVRRVLRATTGIDEVTIFPSAAPSTSEVVAYLEDCVTRVNQDQTRLMIRVALDDSQCPEFCASLEANGFSFCGVLPEVEDRDWVLYSRFESAALADINLYTTRAHEMRDYMASLA